MLHWYVAMGCVKQHHLQEVMLARVRDIALAQTLVRVVQRVLCVGHTSVRYLCKDAGVAEVLRWSWCEQYRSVRMEGLPLVSDEVVAAAKSVGAGTAVAGCLLFLFDFLSGFLALLGLLPAVTAALQYEAVDSVGDRSHEMVGAVELKVAYTHEGYNCRVPPAEVRLPGIFAGSLISPGLWNGCVGVG